VTSQASNRNAASVDFLSTAAVCWDTELNGNDGFYVVLLFYHLQASCWWLADWKKHDINQYKIIV